MKKLILLTLTFCYSINSFSQVGIGTAEPNASSQLEVKADDKGVLLPQVALQSTTDNNTISNGNVVSLLVYNTNNSDDLKAGYYFWDGSKWMSLGSQSSVSIDGGTGAPDDDNPANPQGGDIYVDNETGDIYTHNGDEWVQAGSGSGSTTTPGAGSPNEDANGPSDPQAGDLYVDTDTGDIYTYSGDQWTNKSKVVSDEDDNVIEEDDNGLAFLPPAALESAMGKTSGSGPPSENNPTNPQGGDLYVDETNGDIYTHNGDEWVQSGSGGGSTTTPGAGSPNEDANGPSDPQAGDLYVNTDTGDIYTYSGDQWTNKSKVVSSDENNVIIEGTDALAFLDAGALKRATGKTSGSGPPSENNPTNPQGGDLYVDEASGDIYTHNGDEWVESGSVGGSTTTPGAGNPNDEGNGPSDPQAGDLYVDTDTGDIYTYSGDQWTNKSKVVSEEEDNVIEEDDNGLAFLPPAALESATGKTSGEGPPMAMNPENPQPGDLYVDETNGDIYTHNGDEWVKSGSGGGSTTTPGVGNPNNEGNGPSDPQAGDLYVDETSGDIYTYSGDQWTNKSKVVSEEEDNVIEEDDNGLAFLPPAALESATGKTSGEGPPTAMNPENPQPGDLYVDETNGDIYTHNGDEWVKSGSGGGSTTTPGVGNPNNEGNGPSDPQAGDLYVDETSGDIYTYSGDQWTNKSKVVSEEEDNVIEEDDNGLAFLPPAALESATGKTSGEGPPTAINPENPQPGDLYVDETNGDIYTHNGDEWVKSGSGGGSTTTPGAGNPNDEGNGPSDPQAGDLYVDETSGDIYTYSGDQWTNKSKVVSEEDDNAIQEDENGLAFLNKSELETQKKQSLIDAESGQTEFSTPLDITDIEKIDVYRNGIRIAFMMMDETTIKLGDDISCLPGDKVLIVQIK